MKEALLYEKLDDKKVRCFLCSHRCTVAPGAFGVCGVRQNNDGFLYTHVYGSLISSHVDPIEKKPLYHFLPGSQSFSIATIGCNFQCGFCQNWEISQARTRDGIMLHGDEVSCDQVVQTALEHECQSISYTYTEPTIFFEYALDIARLAKEKGLYNNFVTNGYMTEDCLMMVRPYLHAANVDLKFFRDESYRRICGATLEPVLETIRLMHALGIWLEITTLIVTGENDSEEEMRELAEFIAGIDKNIPWHISRFHPDYKFLEQKATPEATLKKVKDIGHKAGLTYIYVGNVWGWGSDTLCPQCHRVLIKREMFSILENHIIGGKCSYCQADIAGIFS